MHTQVLWVQLAVARRGLRIDTVPGGDNPADMGSKHLPQAAMRRCMGHVGLHFRGGRSQIALRTAGTETTA